MQSIMANVFVNIDNASVSVSSTKEDDMYIGSNCSQYRSYHSSLTSILFLYVRKCLIKYKRKYSLRIIFARPNNTLLIEICSYKSSCIFMNSDNALNATYESALRKFIKSLFVMHACSYVCVWLYFFAFFFLVAVYYSLIFFLHIFICSRGNNNNKNDNINNNNDNKRVYEDSKRTNSFHFSCLIGSTLYRTNVMAST
jgi:hypothetical protein